MTTYLIAVKILPRPEVLDTQGRAVEATLKEGGLNLEHCRVGKYMEISVNAENQELALNQVREMAEYVLYNPLIENFELEVKG
ncbi:MAG TPA: phosphoribosylformylglycinamidine synthase, purS protein [Bdellovibrionales bacterium]|nr:phosphoribosylformylglycinamidine synthase, purS protein [Pseudobdellovibrionaceae bacterium]HAG90344.1 phosphoribosylformylglycinamidine synthase, purS protein [Bdellovibrionales bacterium]|tara:strand:+ start:4362 stop:4610 length:249 start_codon:yes stop_codon:yes gene_type:complete